MSTDTRPLAITGMACRFPGAQNYQEFWANQLTGEDQIRQLDDDRWQADSFYSPDPNAPDRSISRWCGAVEEIERFDAEFFGISPREAQRMDPQQRWMLELCWHCIEDAGMDPRSLRGREVGVFVGVSPLDYKELQEGFTQNLDAHTVTGSYPSLVANRISFSFDLRGASFPVDTACSSSLVALHQAMSAIQEGSCEMALVGGVNLLCRPTGFITMSKLGALSPSGKLRAFSEGADGYVRGEGAGVILLESLESAQQAGRRIHGLLLASAVNHGGEVRTLTSPSPYGQSRVVVAAMNRAGVHPDSISYIEAHGTGTPLGDPIEINGLRRAYGELYRRAGEQLPANPRCAIGSVKTYIGHPEAAAGIAGVIKVLLAMTHGYLPQLANFTAPNPRLNLDGGPFFLLEHSRAWETPPDQPRRAGVSSFGFGGANAHAVLEEAPTPEANTQGQPRSWQILPLSTHNAAAMAVLTERYQVRLQAEDWQAVCHGAARHRACLAQRLAVVADSATALASALTSRRPIQAPSNPPRIAFLFTGQGSQQPGMGRELYAEEPVFRQILERCAAGLDGELDRPLLDLLFNADAATLAETGYTQPTLFALEYALACQWRHWGLEPEFLLGHSVGELVAACLAGVFSLEDALRLVAARGRLMQALPRNGAMLAVSAPAERVQPFLVDHPRELALAALNAPTSVVVSGHQQRVSEVQKQLEAAGLRCTPLAVSHAFHSPLLEPMLADYRAVAATITYHPPQLKVISNLDGQPAGEAMAHPDYWVRQAREAVNFSAGMATLASEGCDCFLEIGPKPVLLGLGRQTLGLDGATWLASLRPGQAESRSLLESLAGAFEAGVAVNWQAFYEGRRQPQVDLPLYPFQGQTHWVTTTEGPARGLHQTAANIHPLLGEAVDSPLPGYQFRARPGEDRSRYLLDHRVGDDAVFPAAGYLELALAAASHTGHHQTGLCEVRFHRPLRLPDSTLHTVLSSDGGFQVFARADDHQEWQCYASGRLANSTPAPELPPIPALDRAPDYPGWAERGLQYHTQFQSISHMAKVDSWVWGRLRPPHTSDGHHLHPTLLDGALQLLLEALPESVDGTLYLPAGVDHFSFHRSPGDDLHAAARLLPAEGKTLLAEVILQDHNGPVAWIQGLRLAPVQAHHGQALTRQQVDWKPVSGERSTVAADQSWLVLGDDHLAADLRRELGQAGHRADHRGLEALAELPDAGRMVLLCPPPPVEPIAALGNAMALAQALLKWSDTPRLWIVTRGAQAVTDAHCDPGGASLWGFARSLARECPSLQTTLVDFHGDDPASLLNALLYDNDIRELACLNDQVLVPALGTLDRLEPPCRLQLREYGRLDALAPAPLTRTTPGPGEVEIQVHGAGLNFRDVLYALGMLREFSNDPMAGVAAADLPFGFECVGEVATLGAGVSTLRVGEPVLAVLTRGSLGSHVTVAADFVAPLSPTVDPRGAATLPLAHLTAHHGLVQLAGLQAGERVLIHAAGGGVGQAALQLALGLGAEVHATAHPDKWDWLRSQGVAAVYHSRQPGFLETLRQNTAGHGVDVVLNSLSGDFITESLDALAPEGRFVEIGKLGIWSPEAVAQRRPDVSYHVFDLGEVGARQPALIADALKDLASGLANGTIKPLPHRVHGLAEASAAFQAMARGEHRGKRVVVMPGAPLRLNPEASYLVTGGSGGLAPVLCHWLLDQGAKKLLLSGRRSQEEVQTLVASLGQRGATVRYQSADLNAPDAVAELLASCAALGPLDGIIHAAGLLDDGVIGEQTPERLQRVLAPKLAAWQLHLQTRQQPLRFFVTLSSVVSLLGSPGQTAYAAANAFLDGLAHHRRAAGLPGLSVNLGPMAGGGMAANLDATLQQRLRAQGWRLLAADEVLEALGELLMEDATQVALLAVDWQTWVAQSTAPSPLLSDLVETAPTSTASALESLAGLPPAQRRSRLDELVREQLAGVLGLASADTVEPRHRLFDLGIDSLLAVELKNRLEALIGQPLRTTLVFDFPTVSDLVTHLAELANTDSAGEETPPETTTPTPEVSPEEADLDELSEDQLAEMLSRELGSQSSGQT